MSIGGFPCHRLRIWLQNAVGSLRTYISKISLVSGIHSLWMYSIESRSVVLLLYWRGRWQGVELAQGLDRGLESAGTGVARGLLGASISNVICEGRK